MTSWNLKKKATTITMALVGWLQVLPVQAAEVGAYYPSWSGDHHFYLKQLQQSGLAAQFTYLNYAFENIYPMPDGSYRCNNGNDIADQTGLGMHATIDYVRSFSADESVDGSADQ